MTISITFKVKTESHDYKRITEKDQIIQIEETYTYGKIWDELMGQLDREEEVKRTVFLKAESGEIVIGKERRILENVEIDDESPLIIELKIKINFKIELEVFVDMDCDLNWARRKHPYIKKENILLSKEVWIDVHVDDPISSIKQIMNEHYLDRFKWDESSIRSFSNFYIHGKMNEYLNADLTFRKNGLIPLTNADDKMINPSLILTLQSDILLTDFFDTEWKPHIIPASIDIQQDETIGDRFLTPINHNDKVMKLVIHDLVGNSAKKLHLFVEYDLKTKDYKWGNFVMNYTRDYFGEHEEIARLTHDKMILDPEETIWKIMEDSFFKEVSIEFEKENMVSFDVNLENMVYKNTLLQSEKMSGLMPSFGFRKDQVELIGVTKKEEIVLNWNKTVVESEIERFKEFKIRPTTM